ncbi:BRCT domain-containing protein [Clostridium sp. VAP41]|uniref:BRCT domain-containing protein n=1 Tax=Clostridium sp. VAP41 TaxID=2949979 RepID=UPI00207AAF68|nr:BRCT domain-containing protein [Clostridium sp. VAP41]
MDKYILIDIETGSFEVESGIYEVALIVVENNEIIKKIHFGEIEDESMISNGFGNGYYECSENEKIIGEFKEVLAEYSYPLVAHNGSFDRKFLVYYNWIDEEYPFYDSLRAIKVSNTKLFSYSMSHLIDYLGFNESQKHTAMGDVELLFEVINRFNPTIWLPIGEQARRKRENGSNRIDFKAYNFEIVKDIFEGKTLVFTGKGFYERKYLAQLAIKCGAIVDKGVTKRTDILVVGTDAGSKLEKAKELGSEIMDMADFHEMVFGVELEEVYKTNNKEQVLEENIGDSAITELLKGKKISLYPMKVSLANKVSEIVSKYGGIPLSALRVKETDLLVYQPYAEDMVTVQRARDKGIETMTLGRFNKLINEKTSLE